MEYYEKYKHNMKNIPFEEIDEGVRNVVCVFNRLGYNTIFSCQGHEEYEYPYVIFDNNIKDIDIAFLAKKFLISNVYKGYFCKWVRNNNGKIWENWVWKLDYNNNTLSQRNTKKELKDIVEVLDNLI